MILDQQGFHEMVKEVLTCFFARVSEELYDSWMGPQTVVE